MQRDRSKSSEISCFRNPAASNYLALSARIFSYLRENFLLATAGAVIAEASPYDRIWGIGLGQNDQRALDPTNGAARICWDLR